MSVEPSVVAGVPPLLGDEVVVRLHIEFVDKVGPVGRADDPKRAGPIGAPWCSTGHVDQHDGESMAAERVGQAGRPLDDLSGGMDRGRIDDPFCKSITMSAGLGSKVVRAIVSSFL